MQNELQHSAKGSHWQKKNHKYIAIENGKYIYPEDVQKGGSGRHHNVSYGSSAVKPNGNRIPSSGTARDIRNRQGVKKVEYYNAGNERWRDQNKIDKYGRKSITTDFSDGNRFNTPVNPSSRVHDTTKKATSDKIGTHQLKMEQAIIERNAQRKDQARKYLSNRIENHPANSRQQYAKDVSAKKALHSKQQRNRAEAANGNGAQNQKFARSVYYDRKRRGLYDSKNFHRPGLAAAYDEKGVPKNQNLYYDDKGVKKNQYKKYDTAYDEKGVRKYHSDLEYYTPEKEVKKNFIQRKKEEMKAASEERKWNKKKKELSKDAEKRFKKRQKIRAKEEKQREKELDKQLPAAMRRKRNIKRGKKAVHNFLDKLTWKMVNGNK